MRSPLYSALRVACAGVAAFAAISAYAAGLPVDAIAVELCLNGDPSCAQSILWKNSQGDFYADAATLAELRLHAPAAGSTLVNRFDQPVFALSRLPGASYAFDEKAQRLNLTVDPKAFESFQMTAPRLKQEPVSSHSGGFLDYDVLAGYSDILYGAGTVDVGLHAGTGAFRSTSVLEAAEGVVHSTRLETRFVHDNPDTMTRLVIGDGISEAASWGGALRFAGIQYGRNFETQPWLITSPLLTARGSAIVPSTVDVLLNGQSVASSKVPAGPFAIERLPVMTGAGTLEVVTRDALGREQVVSQQFYSSTELLAPGLSDYSFSLGTVRREFGQRQAAYSGLLATGSWRRGLNDALTLQAHGEYLKGITQALGIEGALRLGTLGVLSTSFAASHSTAGTGALAGLGVSRHADFLTFSVQGLTRSSEFRAAVDFEHPHTPKQRLLASVGGRLLNNLSLTIGAVQDETELERSQGYTANLSWSNRWGQISLLGSDVGVTNRDRGFYLSFTRALGARSSVNLSSFHESRGDRGAASTAAAAIQRSAPLPGGVGYSLRSISDGRYDAHLTWRHDYGTLGVDTFQAYGRESHRLQASGSLIAFGGDLRATRSLDQSYALVDAEGLANVQVRLENQVVGRTGADGRLLVSGLRPYELNRLSFDSSELPLDVQIQTQQVRVRPANRAGVLVKLPLTKVRATIFHLKQVGGNWVPAGAALKLGDNETIVGFEGMVFLEARGPELEGAANWEQGACRFTLKTPSGEGVQDDFGTVSCE